MDIKSVLKRYDTKSTNTSNLMPSHVNRDANIKLLAKLEARNRANKANHQYHFKSMLDQLKGRSTMAMLDNPRAYAQVQDPNLTNQKAELVRMAKITANEARKNMGTYDEAREQFITNYSPKINQFRMLPEIQGIFQQFSDPSYSEKGYDKNYLGQGASDKYLESIIAGRQSEQLKKSLEDLNATQATTTGAVQGLLNPIQQTNARLNAMFIPLNQTNASLRDLQRDLLSKLDEGQAGILGLGKTITDIEERRLMLKDAGERTVEEIQEQEANNKKIKEEAKARFEASKASVDPLTEQEAYQEVANEKLEEFKKTKNDLEQMSYVEFTDLMTRVPTWTRNTFKAPTQLGFIKTQYNNMNKAGSVLNKRYMKMSKKLKGAYTEEEGREVERENNELKKNLILDEAKISMKKSVSTGFKSFLDVISPPQKDSASGTVGGAGAGPVQTPKPSGGILSGLFNSAKKNLFGQTVAEQQAPLTMEATAQPDSVLDFTGDIDTLGLEPLNTPQSGGKRRSQRKKGKR